MGASERHARMAAVVAGMAEESRVGQSTTQLYREVARTARSSYINKMKVKQLALRTGLLSRDEYGCWTFNTDELAAWVQFHWEANGLGRRRASKAPLSEEELDRMEKGNLTDRRRGRRGSRAT